MLQGKLKFLQKLIDNPKKIFLMDSLEALLTAFSLYGVLAQFPLLFGMPVNTLYLLSGVALFFFVYSISCHFLISNNWSPFLILIICFNLIYSTSSLILVLLHSESLTLLGWSYFILEVIIICIVVTLEYLTLNQLKKISNQLN